MRLIYVIHDNQRCLYTGRTDAGEDGIASRALDHSRRGLLQRGMRITIQDEVLAGAWAQVAAWGFESKHYVKKTGSTSRDEMFVMMALRTHLNWEVSNNTLPPPRVHIPPASLPLLGWAAANLGNDGIADLLGVPRLPRRTDAP